WQLDHEIKSKKLNDEKLDELMKPERWVDYQEIFGKKYNFEQAVGLQEALMLCDIEPDGRMHDGLDDAWNTARLIEKLEKNPNYKLI
ncbi:exonuclease, partial [Xanthomonas citri pv. citri]|nr:exonuclease [Xanthomonas citri pv. citri]